MLLNDVKINVILESHLIPAETLRTGDFVNFYQARKQRLLVLIEKVMGKTIIAIALPEESDDDKD